MDQIPNKEYQISFENNSASNYLVLRPDPHKELIDYQVQMLLNNRIPGLLDFHINFAGDNVNCFYDVTSKCLLANIMSRKRFTRYDFLKMMLIIVNSLYDLKNFLLNDKNIILDESNVYVDPESMRVFFIYLPVIGCNNSIQSFMVNMILKLTNFQDEESDNYFQKIIENLKSEHFSLLTFKRLLEELLGQDIQNGHNDCLHNNEFDGGHQSTEKFEFIKSDKCNAISNIPKKTKKDRPKNKDNTDKLTIQNQHSDKKKGIVKIPHIPAFADENRPKNESNRHSTAVHEAAEKHRKDSEGKILIPTNPNRLVVLKIILQPFLVVFLILLLTSDWVRMSDSPLTNIIILVLIIIAVDVLLIRLINEKKIDAGNAADNNKILELIEKKVREKDSESNSHADEAKEMTDTEKIPETFPEEKQNCPGETVILRRSKPIGIPYLKEIDGEEVIELNKNSILIGRMKDYADYVINSNAVGKIHAELIKEDDSVFIVDSNSKNGTFINNERLKPNTKTRVNNNDILRFANKEFVFVT